MDIIFHAVSGLVISNGISNEYLISASLAATLPDIFGLFYYQIEKINNSNKTSLVAFGKSIWGFNNRDAFFSNRDKFFYFLFHSIWMWLIFSIFMYLVFHDIWIVLSISYLSHLIFDSYTHGNDFTPMPLFPISRLKLNFGKPWTTSPRLYFFNWSILILLLLII